MGLSYAELQERDEFEEHWGKFLSYVLGQYTLSTLTNGKTPPRVKDCDHPVWGPHTLYTPRCRAVRKQ